jgi:hypothetical protein
MLVTSILLLLMIGTRVETGVIAAQADLELALCFARITKDLFTRTTTINVAAKQRRVQTDLRRLSGDAYPTHHSSGSLEIGERVSTRPS